MFSGFLIVSVVFTMFVAAVPWLPLLLAVIEFIVRKQEEKGNRSFQPIPYVVAGAVVIGLVVLAGHPELIYYTLLVAGAYAFVRLVAAYFHIRRQSRQPSPFVRLLKLAGWLLTMAVAGVALGAVQLIPLVELLPLNFREGSASLPAGAGLGVAEPPRADLCAAQRLRQPQPPPVVRHLGARVDARHRQRAGRADPYDLLGHQELRRRRQLRWRCHMAAGGDCADRGAASGMGEEERRRGGEGARR